jgi:ectoine hydroxylase-related dioxygenase (phytanoyl-CoA dioxygenase family)
MSKEEALRYKNIVLETDDKLGLMNSDYRCKSNVLFPWVDEISRNKKLISYLEQIIGPNIHCWDTLFWIKKPGDGRDVSFHQDATYWNFDNKHKAVTVWFAFDDVTEEHGSIEYVQGSHVVFQRRHNDIKNDTNLLMRGQTVDADIPKERVKTRVPAGNVLIHSPYIIHGSGMNRAATPRVAMGMIFASTECKPLLNLSPESTVLVSGVDNYDYMIQDPRPTGMWEVDKENWRKAYDRQHINYYKIEQQPN